MVDFDTVENEDINKMHLEIDLKQNGIQKSKSCLSFKTSSNLPLPIKHIDKSQFTDLSVRQGICLKLHY